MQTTIFAYGDKETQYLKDRCKRLGALIERVGPIEREVIPDLFTCLVHAVVGQQISSKAQKTIWGRMSHALGAIRPDTILSGGVEIIQACGLSYRKAGYIVHLAKEIDSGALTREDLERMSDEEIIERLVRLPGVGVWTAEMTLIFCLQRPDVLSYGDVAIHRGLRMVHRHKWMDRERFERYRRRYSPHGSVASLYLWRVAGEPMVGWEDPEGKR